MEFPQVICLTADRSFALHVRQAIGLSCARIAVVTDVAELSTEWCATTDLLLLDAQYLEEIGGLGDSDLYGEIILVSPTDLEASIQLLERGCNHIVGGNPMASSTELLAAIRKLRSADIFGLKKYVPWGAHCYESRVASLIDKRNVVSWVAATAHRVGCARWLTVELEMAADELLTNAIYPEQGSGERFQSGPVSSALFQWACMEGCIHISVTDQRGTFNRSTMIAALRELAAAPDDELCLLGLPRQITLAQRLVVNVVPGQRTEVIVSLPLRGRKTPMPSISFFSSNLLPVEASATEPTTINLSGQLAVDSIGLRTEVSIREIDDLSAEVMVEQNDGQIYPGICCTLAINVPFHGELKASGLVFRVKGDSPTVLSLSFATGHEEWERLFRAVGGQSASRAAR